MKTLLDGIQPVLPVAAAAAGDLTPPPDGGQVQAALAILLLAEERLPRVPQEAPLDEAQAYQETASHVHDAVKKLRYGLEMSREPDTGGGGNAFNPAPRARRLIEGGLRRYRQAQRELLHLRAPQDHHADRIGAP